MRARSDAGLFLYFPILYFPAFVLVTGAILGAREQGWRAHPDGAPRRHETGLCALSHIADIVCRIFRQMVSTGGTLRSCHSVTRQWITRGRNALTRPSDDVACPDRL
jgi:hypothetical protein